jgi:uncharacterized DUF497 family protein
MDRYEWDLRKERANSRKHGVTFEEASSALRDPRRVTRLDVQHGDEENRMLTVGLSYRGRLLALVTTEGLDGTIRIISAWRATKRERNAYEAGYF